MDDNLKAWLFDILNAISEIESFFSNQPKIFSTYQENIVVKRAFERNMELSAKQ